MCSIATKFFGKRLTSSFYCDIISMLNFTQVKLYEPLAQAAEHLPFKQGVPGSIPGWLTNGPLVKRLRHRPFTAESWVRFPYGSPSNHLPNGLMKPFGRFRFVYENEIVRCLSAILFFQRTNLFYLSALCLFLRKSKAPSMASETRACAVSNWCE